MRRTLAILLTALMLANLVAWPSAALAEILQHEHESAPFDAPSPSPDPSAASCQHGCAGHYGHHFLWQATAPSFEAAQFASASIDDAGDSPLRQHIPPSHFRPPLAG